MNNISSITRANCYSLIYICFTFIVYLFLAYSNSFLGYIAVPLYIISYIINIILILTSLMVSKLTPTLIILSLLSSVWIIWGLSSEIYFDGLNSKVMIPLIIITIISTILRHPKFLRN